MEKIESLKLFDDIRYAFEIENQYKALKDEIEVIFFLPFFQGVTGIRSREENVNNYMEDLEIFRDQNATYKEIMNKKIRPVDNKFKMEISAPIRREGRLNFKLPNPHNQNPYKAVSSNIFMQNNVSNINNSNNQSLNFLSRKNTMND